MLKLSSEGRISICKVIEDGGFDALQKAKAVENKKTPHDGDNRYFVDLRFYFSGPENVHYFLDGPNKLEEKTDNDPQKAKKILSNVSEEDEVRLGETESSSRSGSSGKDISEGSKVVQIEEEDSTQKAILIKDDIWVARTQPLSSILQKCKEVQKRDEEIAKFANSHVETVIVKAPINQELGADSPSAPATNIKVVPSKGKPKGEMQDCIPRRRVPPNVMQAKDEPNIPSSQTNDPEDGKKQGLVRLLTSLGSNLVRQFKSTAEDGKRPSFVQKVRRLIFGRVRK